MIKKCQNDIEINSKNDIIYLEYRCPYCNKLLFNYTKDNDLSNVEVKCGRCKKIIIIK